MITVLQMINMTVESKIAGLGSNPDCSPGKTANYSNEGILPRPFISRMGSVI